MIFIKQDSYPDPKGYAQFFAMQLPGAGVTATGLFTSMTDEPTELRFVEDTQEGRVFKVQYMGIELARIVLEFPKETTKPKRVKKEKKDAVV